MNLNQRELFSCKTTPYYNNVCMYGIHNNRFFSNVLKYF